MPTSQLRQRLTLRATGITFGLEATNLTLSTAWQVASPSTPFRRDRSHANGVSDDRDLKAAAACEATSSRGGTWRVLTRRWCSHCPSLGLALLEQEVCHFLHSSCFKRFVAQTLGVTPHIKHVVKTRFLSDPSQKGAQLIILDGEETSPEMATQGSRTRSLSSCEAEWSLLQHLQLHLTLKRCATKSQWCRGSEVLGCTSIACTPYLLTLARALRDGNRSARIRVEEDFYPIKPRSWMS
ncbi:hypothetical protein TSMEX_001230 [Taenia solium]|eukprot:TsM_000935100 transcript=TsM_000935100 gene=TsM_000935100